MIHEEYLPNALAVDVPYELFWHLNPKKLECFKAAHAIKRRMADEEMYRMGIYVTRAVGVAVEHCLCGEKAISEYFKAPILSRKDESEEVLTEEQKLEFQKQLLMQLQIMESNFKATHSEKEINEAYSGTVT